MKNKFLLLLCTLLVVGIMTLSVPFEGSAQLIILPPKGSKSNTKSNMSQTDLEAMKNEASRKAEEKLEQQIDEVYEAGLKLKEDIKKAEAERDGFNGAGLSPTMAEAKYYELDVKCLELRSQYEILVLQLEELQEEYAKLIGD